MEPTLGEKIKRARRDRGLTLRQLADETGVNHTIISRIENGEREASATALLKICTYLDLLNDADAELAVRGIKTGDLVIDSPALDADDVKKLQSIARKLARAPKDKRRLALAMMAGAVADIVPLLTQGEPASMAGSLTVMAIDEATGTPTVTIVTDGEESSALLQRVKAFVK